MTDATVWIVDDDHAIRWVMERALGRAGFETECFASADEVLERIDYAMPDAVVSDIRMPGADGLELLASLQARRPELPVIIMTAHSDLDSAVSSFETGAFEYLAKPFDTDHALATVERAVAKGRERVPGTTFDAASVPTLKKPHEERRGNEIIGTAPAMQEVFRAIGRLAKSTITVMIEGASGTGKELVAHALHRHSQRAKAAFVPLNMAAIPSELIESELFGHERGAFTGAREQRIGRFEQADGGTLFLDEIGDMPPAAQTRLLRILAEGEFYRVGGRHSVRVNARIITATHRDLRVLVAEGRFREDLYHRLNVIRVHVPTLAERRSDIPILASHFLQRAAAELGGECRVLLPATLAHLQSLDWPGNVRQLQNACNWLTVMAPGREVLVADLPPELRPDDVAVPAGQDWQLSLGAWARAELAAGNDDVLVNALPTFESTLIRIALEQSAGRKVEAARLLGWGRNTLTRKLAALKIDA